MLLAAPAGASAASYYVDATHGVDGTNTCGDPAAPCLTIGQALTNAILPGDVVNIGGGNYNTAATTLTLANSQTLVRNNSFSTAASPGVPTIATTCAPPPASVISVTSAATISGLAIQLCGAATQTAIDVVNGGNQIITANLITASAPGTSTGISINQTALTPTGAQLTRNQILGLGTGVKVSNTTGSVTLSGDLIAQSTSVGLDMGAVSPSTGNVSATNATIVRSAVSDVKMAGDVLTLGSSIIGDAGIDSAVGLGTCHISYSRGPVAVSSGGAGGCGSGSADFQIRTPLVFTGGVLAYDLPAGSPLIDAGNPSPGSIPAPPNPLGLDIYGRDRIRDGNADCTERIDIGAAEFQPTSGGCTVPGDTSVRQRSLFEILSISRSINIGSYVLCVDGPGRRQCKRFQGRRSSSVNWSRSFNYKGQGHYVVDWFKSDGRTRLGPTQQFDWGPCAPANLSLKGIWRPSRLLVLDRCRTATFFVNGSFQAREDRDFHVRVSPIAGTPRALRVFEIIPRDQPRHLPRPIHGRRVRVTGVYVCDTFHGPLGHTEIHPAFRIEILQGNTVVRTFQSGPQYAGTPNVTLVPKGRFHCPSI